MTQIKLLEKQTEIKHKFLNMRLQKINGKQKMRMMKDMKEM